MAAASGEGDPIREADKPGWWVGSRCKAHRRTLVGEERRTDGKLAKKEIKKKLKVEPG